MRITFILDRLNLGGAERHTLNLAKAFAARGYDVQTIVLFTGGSDQFPVGEFPNKPVLLGAGGLTSIKLFSDLRRTLNKFLPDVVFAINQSSLVATTLVRITGERKRWRLCCIFHTTEIHSRLGQLKIRLFRLCTAQADTLIFVSLRQSEYWIRRGMQAKQISVIQNGINTDNFGPADPAVRAIKRENYGLGQHKISLTLVGRLSSEKNHAWAIETLSSLRELVGEEADPLHLVFVGEGPLRAELEALVSAQKLQDNVTFVGSMSNIVPALAQADCGILVSNAVETFSLAALELMASGLPMIMTDIGGATEIVIDGVHGHIVPVGDKEALQRAFMSMLDPDLRARMGESARKRVLENFTFENMVDQYEVIVTSAAMEEGK